MALDTWQVNVKFVCHDGTEDLHKHLVLSPPLSSSTKVFMLSHLAKQAYFWVFSYFLLMQIIVSGSKSLETSILEYQSLYWS